MSSSSVSINPFVTFNDYDEGSYAATTTIASSNYYSFVNSYYSYYTDAMQDILHQQRAKAEEQEAAIKLRDKEFKEKKEQENKALRLKIIQMFDGSDFWEQRHA